MYWTFELADSLLEAPWPANKKVLLDFCARSNVPSQVLENIQELPDDGREYNNIEDIWPDYLQKGEYFYEEEQD